MPKEKEMQDSLKVGYYEVELTYDAGDCTLIYSYKCPVPYSPVNGEDEESAVREAFYDNFVSDDIDIVGSFIFSIAELLKNDRLPKEVIRLLEELKRLEMRDWVCSEIMGVQPHIYDRRYDIVKSVVSKLKSILRNYPLSYDKVRFILDDLDYLKLVYYMED